jgi:hypothetical protein
MSRESEPERLAGELDRKLDHVIEPRMRVWLFERQVEQLEAPRMFALLAHVLRRPPVGAGRPVDVLSEQLHLWLPRAAYELRVELYRLAREANDVLVMGLLRSHETRSDDDPATQGHLSLRDVPLGRRRSLARARDPLLLEKLAHDPDPVVIANLLANPRTTEGDVLRISALRPVAASTLAEIARSPRWSRRPRVRVALTQNPHCPPELALAQLGALPRAELREIASHPQLDPVLRAHAELELERRAGSTG